MAASTSEILPMVSFGHWLVLFWSLWCFPCSDTLICRLGRLERSCVDLLVLGRICLSVEVGSLSVRWCLLGCAGFAERTVIMALVPTENLCEVLSCFWRHLSIQFGHLQQEFECWWSDSLELLWFCQRGLFSDARVTFRWSGSQTHALSQSAH